MKKLFCLLACAMAVHAQDQLTLRQAVLLALQQNKSLVVSRAAIDSAAAQSRQARAGMLPRINYTESAMRSNNPVFVFSSLLTQHQFEAGNFNIAPLNRPGFLDNFQSTLSVDQALFDAGQTRKSGDIARIGEKISEQGDKQARSQIILATVKAYLDAVLSRDALTAAHEALKSATADLTQAEQVRQAGMSTDADVLSVKVHLARVREQEIQRQADFSNALATLNDVLSLPLDAPHELVTPITPVVSNAVPIEALEKSAIALRPEQRRADFMVDKAASEAALARTSLWPRIGVHGVFETDRQQFANHGGANWLGAVSLTWNLFNGGADKARIDAAAESLVSAQAERDRTGSSVKLEVRRAWQDLIAAGEQVEVSQSAVAQAEESLRITQNRYGAGMSTVTDLLRTEAAVLDSRTRHLAALHDQHLAAALLEFASGGLSADSPSVVEQKQ